MGNGYGMLYHERLIQCNRVCISQITVSIEDLWKATKEQVKPPKWIMVAWENYYSDDDAYYILDHYDEMYSFEHDKVYFENPMIGNHLIVYIYRRKD